MEREQEISIHNSTNEQPTSRPLDEYSRNSNGENRTDSIRVEREREDNREDGTIIGGLGSSVKELIVDKNLENIKIKTFAYPDQFIKHGSVSELEKIYGLDVGSIAHYVEHNISTTINI